MRRKARIRGVRIRRGEKFSGFTSGLFWHFTGGPIIDISEIKERDELEGKKRRTTYEATKILLEILKSKTLKATSEEYLFPNKDENFKTTPFCCNKHDAGDVGAESSEHSLHQRPLLSVLPLLCASCAWGV
jgi:hypothetical protein